MTFKEYLTGFENNELLNELSRGEAEGIIINTPEIHQLQRRGQYQPGQPLNHQQKIMVLRGLEKIARDIAGDLAKPALRDYYAANPQKVAELQDHLKKIQYMAIHLNSNLRTGNPLPWEQEQEKAPQANNTISVRCPQCQSPVEVTRGTIRTRCPQCQHAFFTRQAV